MLVESQNNLENNSNIYLFEKYKKKKKNSRLNLKYQIWYVFRLLHARERKKHFDLFFEVGII